MRRKILIALASGFGLGYAPVASGTFGTIYGVVLYPAWDGLREVSAGLYVLTFVAFVAMSCWIAGEAEKLFAEHDSGKITIDEAAGYFATTLFLPFSIPNAILAFFVFRFFDIWKPWPASVFDRKLQGGYAVVLDDVVGGLYANLVIRAILYFV